MKLQEAKAIMTEVMNWMQFTMSEAPKPEKPFQHTAHDLFKARQLVLINNGNLIKANRASQITQVPTLEVTCAFGLAIDNAAPADGETYKVVSVNGVTVSIERERPVMRVEKSSNQLDLIQQIEEVQSEKTDSL